MKSIVYTKPHEVAVEDKPVFVGQNVWCKVRES